eukprot:TRINITY_DN3284_c0_g1_i1.p1 TRINITY_DN3284_c0_g1~~TRINITY_DN3284_c0_g1_i1.p1  ORF type:complete len:432 (+),score=53.87 TRINITY_DN3284_c0_g1_i1:39-1334(+)
MTTKVVFLVLLSLFYTSSTYELEQLNGTTGNPALLPVFRSPVQVPGFLSNILGDPEFMNLTHWYWSVNTSKVAEKVISLPPTGYLCDPDGKRFWVCQGEFCELEQNLDISGLFDLQHMGVEVKGTVTAITSLWPEDYASVNITVTFWSQSGEHETLVYETDIQRGGISTKITPSSIQFVQTQVLAGEYDFIVFKVQVWTQSNAGEILVGVSDLGLRLHYDYGVSQDVNDKFILLCGKPDLTTVSITSVQHTLGNDDQVFLLEGLQPQQYYYSGHQNNPKAFAYSYSAIKDPLSIEVYHTVFKNPSLKITRDQHLACTLELREGASCDSQARDDNGESSNVTFTYTLNSWSVRTEDIPWEDLIITTPTTPTIPTDESVLTAVVIGFCVLLVFAIASFVGMFIWQKLAKVSEDEVEEDLLGSKYFHDDLDSTI